MAERAVTATLNYHQRDNAEIWFYDPGPDVKRAISQGDAREVVIRDARAAELAAEIDREGFQLVSCPAQIAFNAAPELVRSSFYPAMERLVKEHLGAARVHAFDHDFRSSAVEKQSAHLRPPVTGVHNDYTAISGPQRVRELLPAEADALLKRRFAFINVWKPVGHAAEETPLAVCDVRSVAPGDYITLILRYRDRTGQIYGAKYNPAQRWYYYPAMSPSEALLLKVYDADETRSRFSLHSAFIDPSSSQGAPPRQSIEVRTIAFF